MFIKQRLLVFLFPFLLSLPFLNRAYFVDDSYFVEIAQWVKDHPSQPYHFRVDDAGIQNRGWEEDGFVRMVNPLLHHYYLAFLIKLGGEREWFLRLGCVILSCFSALFLFGLARRWTNEPLLATLLVLVTPVHWLSAHSLLIDSTMGFLFLGGLYYFIQATERDSVYSLVVSGFFMGLAILTKYTALLIIPLTGLWFLLRWKKLSRRWIYVIPWTMGLLFLWGYSLFTAHIYGSPHIIAASQRMLTPSLWGKYLVFFVFLSGSALVPLISWGVLRARVNVFNGIFVVLVALFLSSQKGGFSLTQGGLIALWFLTSLVFFAAFINLYFESGWIYPRDHFLFGWLLGFVAMMFFVMNWVAARYYVIVIPAIVFMTVRMIEIKWPTLSHKILKVVFVATLVFTAALSYADYKQAAPARQLVHVLKNQGFEGGDRHFYLGDSFTMSYLRGEGWIPAFPETQFQPGDQVLGKQVTMPWIWFAKRKLELKTLAVFDFPTRFPLKVMDYKGSAGFYASVWGALPFTFSQGPWERFFLVEVTGVSEPK